MIFNGIEKDYIRVLRELFRPPTPPIEFNVFEKAKGGERVRRKRYGGLELQVPVVIKSPERIEDLKEDLTTWLVHDEPKKLVFKDKPDRYYLAFYKNMELNEYYKMAIGTITFYLPEGYRFGPTNTLKIKTEFNTYVIKGQIKTPWKSKTVFKDSASRYVLEIDNGGRIILNYNFTSGDVLEIDYEKRDVFLNGKDLATAIDIKTEWFELPVGEVQLRASHETELTYIERYY